MPLKVCRRGRFWYLRGTVCGIAVYETTGLETDRPRELAEALRIRREQELLDRRVYGHRPTVTFAEAAAAYLEHRRPGKAEHAYAFRLLTYWAPGWDVSGAPRGGWRLVREIDQAELGRCLDAVLRPGAEPSTRARLQSVVTAILSQAARAGWCDVPAFISPKLRQKRIRWLAPAEAGELLATAGDHLRPLLIFLLGTGARLSEALDLGWQDVDLADARVLFHDTKNGDRRVARLPPAAVAALANLRHRKGAVFRRPDGEPYADRQRLEGGQIKTAFKGACRRAGLGTDVTPHTLRHTWATWFYAASRDVMLLKAEGGWKSLRMVERYTHLMPSNLAPKIASIWGGRHPSIGAEPVQPAARTG